MTLNSRRLSWTTQWTRDRPPHSTPRPQEEGTLHSSSYLYAHRVGTAMSSGGPSPSYPNPNNGGKVRVRARGKARTTAPATTAEAPRLGPPSTITAPAPSRCGQGCVLRSSRRRIHRSTPYLLHRRTTGLPAAPPSRPCRRLHRTSSRPRPLPGRPGRARGINSHWPTPSTPWP
jgi:hypothetical protein